MHITNVKIRKIVKGEKLKAIASITFNDLLAIHDLKIIKTDDSYFVAMPHIKLGENIYKDTVHPINSILREEIENTVLNEYEKVMKNI